MKYGTLFILVCALLALAGCSNTVQGVKQDMSQNAPVVQAAADQAMQSMQKAGKSTTAAVSSSIAKADHTTDLAFLGTQIKAHIISNSQLNDSHNEIDVDAVPGKVTLTGHVVSGSDKSDAAKIARDVISGDHAQVVLKNELTVAPS